MIPPPPSGVADADHLLVTLVQIPDSALSSLIAGVGARVGGHTSTTGSNGSDASDSLAVGRHAAIAGRRPNREEGWQGRWPAIARLAMATRQILLDVRWSGWRCAVQLARDTTLLRTQLLMSVGLGLARERHERLEPPPLSCSLFPCPAPDLRLAAPSLTPLGARAGFTVGSIFFNVSGDLAGFQNKGGALLFLLMLLALGGLSTATTVTHDWPLFAAQWHDGLYNPATCASSTPPPLTGALWPAPAPPYSCTQRAGPHNRRYVTVKLIVELLTLRALPALALGGIFYGLMGLRRSLSAVCSFLVATSLSSINAALICNAIAACAPHSAGSVALVATMVLLLLLLLSGFLMNLDAMPPLIRFGTCLAARSARPVQSCHATPQPPWNDACSTTPSCPPRRGCSC